MERNQLINTFAQLGIILRAIGESKEWSGNDLGVTETEYSDLQNVIAKQQHSNGWFTKENMRKACLEIGNQLTKEGLKEWSEKYTFAKSPKKVAIIMAGNIPLVGFHDFLCVLLSGNAATCKLSSDDKTLLPALVYILIKFQPELENRIVLTENRIGEIDAVIATGSNNSLNYFETYFGKYPHVFRKSRTSIAILDGTESKEQLFFLGADIFNYYGLGCRNVSHLMVPKGYDFVPFFEAIVEHGDVINHFKYGNNYDYNRTVYLMNLHKMLDNNFVLLFESTELFSPLAMIYYHEYENRNDIESYIELHKEQIQAIVGNGYLGFGAAQSPKLDDYADGFDTMNWLNSLN